MSATGHKSGILGTCFTDNGKDLVSASKDGTIKEWDLDVRWEAGAPPKLLNTYSHKLPVERDSGSQGLNLKFLG